MCVGPGVIVTRAAPDAFEETPGRGQLPFEQRGNDNLNRANHSDEHNTDSRNRRGQLMPCTRRTS
jgi:hypothetical protein